MKKLIKQIEKKLTKTYKNELKPKLKSYISSSMISDDCSRKIWYSCHEEYELNLISIDQKRLNDIRFMIKKYIANQLDISIDEGLILIEKDKEFKQFQKNGLRNWHYKHYDYVQYEMGKNGLCEYLIFIFNQDTGAMECENIPFDMRHYDLLKGKAEAIMMMKEPPQRINESPAWFQCKKCQFRKECHR